MFSHLLPVKGPAGIESSPCSMCLLLCTPDLLVAGAAKMNDVTLYKCCAVHALPHGLMLAHACLLVPHRPNFTAMQVLASFVPTYTWCIILC